MITIIDYGSGNLRSISNSFLKINTKPIITNDLEKIAEAEYLVLPGVGNFKHGMNSIQPYKKIIKEHIAEDKPFLGVCLGLQLLLSSSEEAPDTKGLSIFKGKVKKIPIKNHLKVPHMGWNKLDVNSEKSKSFNSEKNNSFNSEKSKSSNSEENKSSNLKKSKSSSIIDGITSEYFYFVHSYSAFPEDESIITATAKYGIDIAAVLSQNNLFATQFHPEKSGVGGLKLLKNFVNMNQI